MRVVGCISTLLLLQSHTLPCGAASSASSSGVALSLSSADISLQTKSNPLARASLEENIHVGHDDVDDGSQRLNVIMRGVNANRARGLHAHEHVLGVKRSLPTALPSPVFMSIPKHNVNSLSCRGGFTPSPRRHLRSTDMNLSSNPPNGENENDKNNNDKNENGSESKTESGSKHENKKNNKSRNANNSNVKNRKELSKMPKFPIQPYYY